MDQLKSLLTADVPFWGLIVFMWADNIGNAIVGYRHRHDKFGRIK